MWYIIKSFFYCKIVNKHILSTWGHGLVFCWCRGCILKDKKLYVDGKEQPNPTEDV